MFRKWGWCDRDILELICNREQPAQNQFCAAPHAWIGGEQPQWAQSNCSVTEKTMLAG